MKQVKVTIKDPNANGDGVVYIDDYAVMMISSSFVNMFSRLLVLNQDFVYEILFSRFLKLNTNPRDQWLASYLPEVARQLVASLQSERDVIQLSHNDNLLHFRHALRPRQRHQVLQPPLHLEGGDGRGDDQALER